VWLRDGRRLVAAEVAGVLPGLAVWHRRARDRRALAQLDARMLSDIGMTREQAECETNKRFWQA